jgi:hypothetical protein
MQHAPHSPVTRAPRRPALICVKPTVRAFASEVIYIPGLSALGATITRGDNYRAMIEAGHDAGTADQFSFGRNARALDAQPHPRAYEIAVAAARDDRATMFALLAA